MEWRNIFKKCCNSQTLQYQIILIKKDNTFKNTGLIIIVFHKRLICNNRIVTSSPRLQEFCRDIVLSILSTVPLQKYNLLNKIQATTYQYFEAVAVLQLCCVCHRPWKLLFPVLLPSLKFHCKYKSYQTSGHFKLPLYFIPNLSDRQTWPSPNLPAQLKLAKIKL